MLASLLASLALTGCVSKILESKIDEPQVYVLKVGTLPMAAVAYPVQISVALPSAAPGLDTNRIAVLRNTHQLDYFYGARWGSNATQLVQNFLIDSLQTQQGFKGVTTDNARIDADYLLELQLKDFQAEYADDHSNPVVKVSLTGTLINIRTRKPATTINATASVATQDNRLSDVVNAFQSAVTQTGAAISSQLVSAVK